MPKSNSGFNPKKCAWILLMVFSASEASANRARELQLQGLNLQLQGLNEKIASQKLVLERARQVQWWPHVIKRDEQTLALLIKQAAVKKKEIQRAKIAAHNEKVVEDQAKLINDAKRKTDKAKLKKEELKKAIPRIGVLHRYIKESRPYITNRANPDMNVVGGIRKAQQELSEIYENLNKKCDIPLKNVLSLDRSHPENPTIENEAQEKAKAYRERLHYEILHAERNQAKEKARTLCKQIQKYNAEDEQKKYKSSIYLVNDRTNDASLDSMKDEINKLVEKHGKTIIPDTQCMGAGDEGHGCHETRCREDMIRCKNAQCKYKLFVCNPTKFNCPSKGYCEKCHYKWCAPTGNASHGVRRAAEPTPEWMKNPLFGGDF